MKQAPTGVHIWLVLWKATRAVEARALRSVEDLGLCASDFGVLEALLHKGPLPVSLLGKKVLLTSGSMTAAVDRLAARGLVKRKHQVTDRRVRLVELTVQGRRLIQPAFERHVADLDQIASALTPAERATLVSLLRQLGTGAASRGDSGADAPRPGRRISKA